MVAGGVGLAPFATLAEALAARGTPMTLFYGGAHRPRISTTRIVLRALGATLVLTTEDGSRGERGRVTAPLERALGEPRRPISRHDLRLRPDADDARGRASSATRAGRPVFVSLEPVMGCGMGGCYSCVVPRPARRRQPLRALVPRRPGVRRARRRLGRARSAGH